MQTLTATPSLYFALNGTRIPKEDIDPLFLSLTTMGNFGAQADTTATLQKDKNNTITLIEEDEHIIYLTDGNKITDIQASCIISAGDALGCLIFIVFCTWLNNKADAVAEEIDCKNVKSSDFSVCVERLPKDATKEEVLAHFNSLYQLSEPDWEFKGFCCNCCLGRKRRREPIDILDRGFLIQSNADEKQMKEKYPPISPTGQKQVISPVGSHKRMRSWIVKTSKEVQPVKNVSNSNGMFLFIRLLFIYNHINLHSSLMQSTA